MAENLKEGLGEVFTTVDADEMRAFFRQKNKKLVDKRTTVKEAISQYVKNGDYIATGGFGGVRIPTALVHEILRQNITELGFAGHVSTHDCQLLAAGNAFNRVDAAYVVGLEARGLSKGARRIFQSGNIKVTEWSNAGLGWRFKAAAMGLSFMPARSMLGTDTFKYSAAKEILCPFTGQKYMAVPALYPDVALLHVNRADIYGNCQIDGILVADDDIAKAAKRVIITTEKIVPTEEIRREPSHTRIPYWCVDAVIEVPYGSYPANMPGEYYSDEKHIRQWLDTEGNEEEFKAFVKEQILDSKDFYAYLEKNGGVQRMTELREAELLLSREAK